MAKTSLDFGLHSMGNISFGCWLDFESSTSSSSSISAETILELDEEIPS
jgi:hypothetical protein